MEHKSIPFELKDLNFGSRSAIIAHAVYNNIDRVGDISTKGMFTSSWERKDPISFYINHDDTKVPGPVLRTFEDEKKAYTEVKFGKWTLADDVIAMIDEGVIKGASFGYTTEKKDYQEKDGKKVRILRQVRHIETSLLTKNPANPLAGIVSLTKAEDIQNALLEIKETISNMEKFCNNTKASDDAIQFIIAEIKSAHDIIAKYDTASTPPATDGDASRNDDSFKRQLLLFNMQLS